MNRDVKEQDAGSGRYLGTRKVGPKGQILIPKEVRDFFYIQTGEIMVMLAHKDRGIALQKINGCEEVFQREFQKEGEKWTQSR